MTDNEIIKALKIHTGRSDATCKECVFYGQDYCRLKIAEAALDLINRQNTKIEELESMYKQERADRLYLSQQNKSIIAGQETLQKAYKALKADEEREHRYCKNICEPKYKAEIADERAKGDICAAVIARQDKEIECYKARIERFEKIEASVNDFWNEIQKLAKFKNKRKPTLEELLEYMENLKIEVAKEFAVRLKEQKYQSSDWSHGEHPFVVEESDIDNVLYEMVDDTE